jgi:hypothetical protein
VLLLQWSVLQQLAAGQRLGWEYRQLWEHPVSLDEERESWGAAETGQQYLAVLMMGRIWQQASQGQGQERELRPESRRPSCLQRHRPYVSYPNRQFQLFSASWHSEVRFQ